MERDVPRAAPDDATAAAAPPDAPPAGKEDGHGTTAFGSLMLAALGIVYGDIGTSPLYTLRESLAADSGIGFSETAVLGFLSMIFWSLIVVVTIKYVAFVMRADNRGEGGILALTALALRGREGGTGFVGTPPAGPLLAVGIVGAALFYGDGAITPAISVLSAVEGLEVVAPELEAFVLPVAATILTGVFLVQRGGTARVGRLFGPVMVVWFLVLALLGVAQIVQHPSVLRALSPAWAVAYWTEYGWHAFVGLGAVVLSVTGAEALYADMGHLGKEAIRAAWLGFVLPALVLNYFGQGALLMSDPSAVSNPFYLLAPSWATVPLLLLATTATVIASQAVISGAFSLTNQAIQLGLIPRMTIRHTSEKEIGQIYVPQVNWLLLAAVLVLVISFGSSGALASAYGIAVTGTMIATTLLSFIVARRRWRWPLPLALAVAAAFLTVDLAFFGSSLLKLDDGGWFPLALGACLFGTMWTWRRGRTIVGLRLADGGMAVETFLARLDTQEKLRVPGTAVFLARDPERLPHALLHNLKHNKVLHARVILLTVQTRDIPRVPPEKRCAVTPLNKGFFRVVLTYGFKETPHVPDALSRCRGFGLAIDPMETSYFLGRETLVPSSRPDMGPIAERVFIFMSSNATSAAEFFCIPPNRVVELGTQIEI